MKRAAYLFGIVVLSSSIAHADHSIPRSRSGGSGSTDRVTIADAKQEEGSKKTTAEDATARAQLSGKKEEKKKVHVVRRGVSGGSAMTDTVRIETPTE